MTEEFTTYQQALTLKECGFDWKCNQYYTPENTTNGYQWLTSGDEQNYNEHGLTLTTSAPTQALAQKWLREVKGVDIYVIPRYHNGYEVAAKRLGNTPLDTIFVFDLWDSKKPYRTYESALSAGIDTALELYITEVR